MIKIDDELVNLIRIRQEVNKTSKKILKKAINEEYNFQEKEIR